MLESFKMCRVLIWEMYKKKQVRKYFSTLPQLTNCSATI